MSLSLPGDRMKLLLLLFLPRAAMGSSSDYVIDMKILCRLRFVTAMLKKKKNSLSLILSFSSLFSVRHASCYVAQADLKLEILLFHVLGF